MRISAPLREQVRQRADFSCEYYGVTETDTADLLTIDHYRPQARKGSDTLDNLLYCCHRCNGYKADYWPENSHSPSLWNPRQEPATTHFLELADGTLYPLTPTGTFTLNRLRLNRPPLVAYRLRKRQSLEEERLLTRYRDLAALLEQLSQQQAALMEEHRALLAEQRRLLRLLLEQRE